MFTSIYGLFLVLCKYLKAQRTQTMHYDDIMSCLMSNEKKYTWKSKSNSTWHKWDLIEISMCTISKFKLKFINWNRQFHFSYSYCRGISLRGTNHFCLNFRCIFFSKSFCNISNCIFVDVLCIWKRKKQKLLPGINCASGIIRAYSFWAKLMYCSGVMGKSNNSTIFSAASAPVNPIIWDFIAQSKVLPYLPTIFWVAFVYNVSVSIMRMNRDWEFVLKFQKEYVLNTYILFFPWMFNVFL